ncbi:hypothetical protein SAMN04490179_4513 [Pseudomonas antarctica]|uniref:Uncharacterized protein n=1 Tax=Pseudomonas antarctica TaxID=219572 RepID=A0A1H0BVX3_9PSED|nr:hypothetical protein [Pseudomonas antarctica]KAF2406676.1 hypothetical protein PSAN_48530 [Pseudomonas antarctica]SDN49789.1 hypothetical protein SAMN04490179_4513 [Pseudomonas antarctica]
MARTKLEVTPEIELPALDGEALAANQNLMATVLGSHSEERDLVNQLLGQAQMAESFAKFSLTVSTSKLAFVKENKLYRGLSGKKTADGQQFSGTWDEFCSLLGRSRQQVDEDIANLRSLGEEALESMSRMGIGYREMRQYRRLPEDHQAALIEVAKTGDKEAFIDLAEEIIAKHAKEKEALTLRLDEVNADYDAQGEVMAAKTMELDKTKIELEKVRGHIQKLAPNEVTEMIRQEAGRQAFAVESSILGELREALTELSKHAEETGEDQRTFQAGLLQNLELTLAAVRSEFYLTDALVSTPVWLNTAEA